MHTISRGVRVVVGSRPAPPPVRAATTSGARTRSVSSAAGRTVQGLLSEWLERADAEALMSIAPEKVDDEAAQVLAQNLKLLKEQQLNARSLFTRHQGLMFCRLRDWWDFFNSYGFSDDQFKHILTQAPEALASASLVSAGMTIVTLKKLGLDEYGVKQMCVYYPQVLHMDAAQVQSVVKLIGNYQSTHGC